MRSPWIPLSALAALLLLLSAAGLFGCSTSGGCQSSQCAPGNQCIDDGAGGGATCHKVCVKQADCPANYYCNDGLANGGTVSWCAPNTLTYPPGTGEWGTLCRASKGEGANPDCNWDQGFACYGTSPDDANAFCTQFACTADSECPGGWWCSTQNVGPNVTSGAPTLGKTRTVCLPRTYCAPCKKDLDCYAPPNSPAMKCVPDTAGSAFCSTTCANDSTCSLDAQCAAPWKVCVQPVAGGTTCQTDDQCPPAAGTYQHCVQGTCTPECASASDCAAGQTCVANIKVCVPRAGVCVGDGSFCSPCRSDDDCASKTTGVGATQPSGYCLNAQELIGGAYSTERFCSAPATAACDAGAAACPAQQPGANWKAVACTDPPLNQCVGIVTFAGSGIPGCWTANR
jgi:hypothetical protein